MVVVFAPGLVMIIIIIIISLLSSILYTEQQDDNLCPAKVMMNSVPCVETKED